jgi:hypothetical protein
MAGAGYMADYLPKVRITGTFKERDAPRKSVRERWKLMPITSS